MTLCDYDGIFPPVLDLACGVSLNPYPTIITNQPHTFLVGTMRAQKVDFSPNERRYIGRVGNIYI